MAVEVRRIAAQRYYFAPEDIAFITEELAALLESGGFLTMGRHGEEFERRFAALSRQPFAVAVSSGTAALEIILRSLDVAGGEVIVPTNTFAATAFAVLHAGATPVFADCGEDLSVDPEDVARRVTARTKAIVTVHIGGLISPGVQELSSVSQRMGIPLVEDAAHAHGSTLGGQPAGAFGIAAAFSFFSTKVMTTGEGGMIVTGDRRLHEQALVLRDQAKLRNRNVHEEVGHNWRMTETQALLGVVQLRRLDQFIARRRRIAATYDRVLGQARGVTLVSIPSSAGHNFYKYIFLIDRPSDVERIETTLKMRFNVAMGGKVYELPCHRQPVFAHLATRSFPRADDLCRRHLCPPIYPTLADEDVEYVARSIVGSLEGL